MRKTICLVSCVAKKLDGAHPARTLYSPSTFFKAQQSYAETHADSWLILSALHGVVRPDEVIEKYDKTLKTMKKPDRDAWGKMVIEQLDNIITDENIIVLAGKAYKDPIQSWLDTKDVEYPLVGVGGIGSQMQWLQRNSQKNDLTEFL